MRKLNSGKIIKLIWCISGIIILFFISIFISIITGVTGYIPPIEDLRNPIDKYASQVYSSDGVLLGTYSLEKNNRVFSEYENLPECLVNGLIATEDIRFYSHSGIDVKGLCRAFVQTVAGKKMSGGSTITQQLAKQLYSPEARNVKERIVQKMNEWVIAAKLERYYTKEEIINLYLNKYDFGYNAVGVYLASQVYFNKLPNELNTEEAAVLIGMCNNSSYFNPVNYNERTMLRRNIVLDQMGKYGYISRYEADSLKRLSLKLNFNLVSHNTGPAPYFREYLRIVMTAEKPIKINYKPWQKDQFLSDSIKWETNALYGWCNKNKKADGSNYNLMTDGLKIYTTIDSRMQQYAEIVVKEHMGKVLQPAFDKEKSGKKYAPYSAFVAVKKDSLILGTAKNTERYLNLAQKGLSDNKIIELLKKPVNMKVFSWKGEIDTIMSPWDSICYYKSFLRTGFMAMDTYRGYVKAYVGGINYRYFKYDMVNSGRRQVGSTVKPFLYTLLMENGYTPCDEIIYEQPVMVTENGDVWKPEGGRTSKKGEFVTVREGLQYSDNWITVYFMRQVSPYILTRFLSLFGINVNIEPVPSLALGTLDVSVSDMTAAYTSFANRGIRANPVYVTHITDSHGNIVAVFSHKLHEIFTERSYVNMLDMLSAVINKGTARRIRNDYNLKVQMGGKTGTTQNNSDGWFIGFTPGLAVGCWVGGEDRAIHFDNPQMGQGANTALPIVGRFLEKVYNDSTSGYSQSDRFEEIPGYNACDKDAPDLSDREHPANIGLDKMFK